MLEYSFEQLVDLDRVRSLMQTHHKITDISSAILDLEQNILVAVEGKEICTRFHRVHPDTHARCQNSDRALACRLDEWVGEYRECKCQNGLWDIAMPIAIDGRRVATFFIGQFFYDDDSVDEAFFRTQAAEFGFDEEAYIAALRRVPIFSREQIRNILDFYHELIQVLAESGLQKLRLLQEAEERKKAEEALAVREREFRSLAEHLPDNVARWDTCGRHLYVNQIFERTVGLEASKLIGKEIPESVTEFKAAVLRVAESGRAEHSFRHELMVNGALKVHDVSLVPEFDEEGRVKSVLGIGRDMTDLYRLQETIAVRKQEYRSLAESSPDHIIRYDRQGRILYLNNAIVRRLNLSAVDDVIGKRPNEVWPDGRFAAIEQAAARAIESGTVQTVEVSLIGVDGEVLSDHLLIVPERDAAGRIVGSIAFGRDITQLKRLQVALKESETRLQTVLRTMPDMVWLKNSEGAFLFCNHAFERLTGKTESDLINCTDYDIFDADLADFFRQKDQEAIQAGRICLNEEWVTYAVDGQRALLETRKVPVLDSQGQAVGVLGIARDITARKVAEEKLALLNFAINHVQEAAYLIDSDARFFYVNDEAGRALGYSREELLDLTLPDIDPDYPMEKFLDIWSKLRECGSLTFEVTHKKKDGQTFPAEVNANYFMYGGKGYILALARDITERMRTEGINLGRLRLLQFAANHTLEELLKATLDEVEQLTGSAIGFYHFLEPDQKTLFLQAWSTRTHAKLCKSKGKNSKYNMDQAGGWGDCIRQRRPIVHNYCSSLSQHGGLTDGHPQVSRELVVPVMRGDRIVAILGVGNKPENYTDQDVETVSIFADLAWEIAERKQAENTLGLVDYALNQVHEAAFLIDEEGRFHYVNREACRSLGYSCEEFVDLTVSDVDANPSLLRWAEHWRQIKLNDSLTFERLHRKKNGQSFPVEVSANYFEYDGQGYNLALVRDITERKRIETELQNKNRELESFTYSVSHDLKSPLITIRGFAGAITADLAAGRTDRIDKDLQRICNAADKMMTLMDDLLQLSRIGRVINPLEPVDMSCLVNEVVDNLSPILHKNGARVSVQAEMATVTCDRQRILVVLQNFIENAVRYRGRQSELLIQIGQREGGERQVFFVRDNGAGVAPEYHQHIFGLFNRLHPEVPGNGIGLSLVTRIIEEHGGMVWVESDGEGAGSTFCFSLN